MKWSAKYRTHSPQSPPHPGIPSEAGGSWINTRHGGINMSVKSPNTQCLWVGRASKGKVAYESNKREVCRGLHTVNSILHYKGRVGRALPSSKSKCLLGTLRSLKGLFAGEATTIARVRREQKGHTQTMRLGRREGERGDGEWGPFAARTSRLLSSLSIIPAGRERASLSPSLTKIHYVRTAHGERE